MENASKALLIAGAILICILLIAIGMYIYNSANATIKSAASQMSQQEKDIYKGIRSYFNDWNNNKHESRKCYTNRKVY